MNPSKKYPYSSLIQSSVSRISDCNLDLDFCSCTVDVNRLNPFFFKSNPEMMHDDCEGDWLHSSAIIERCTYRLHYHTSSAFRHGLDRSRPRVWTSGCVGAHIDTIPQPDTRRNWNSHRDDIVINLCLTFLDHQNLPWRTYRLPSRYERLLILSHGNRYLRRIRHGSVSQDEESLPRKPGEKKSKPKNKNWKWKLDKKKWKRRSEGCVPKHAWALEIASVLLALAMLTAIVVLLTMRQDKPLPTWPSLLGINSLVAIFSAVFRVALLYPIVEGISELKWIWFATAKSVNDFDRFDSASRVPWGAAKLLVARPSNLFVSLGAVVIILALGIDPFTQQVIRFYDYKISVEGLTATIARTNSYETEIGGGYASVIDPRLVGSVYQGLLNPPTNTTTNIPTYCPSGNCNFAHLSGVAYSSLEICSVVTDVSQSVKGGASGVGGYNAAWNYSLPSGLNINFLNDYGTHLPMILAIWGTDELVGSSGGNTRTLISLEVLMMTTDCSNPFTTADSRQCSIKPLAVTIQVAPCVVQYGNVSISSSMFRETARTSVFLTYHSVEYLSVGVSSSFPNVDCSGSKEPYGNRTTKTAMQYPDSENAWRCLEPLYCVDSAPNDTLWYDPACIFQFGGDASDGLQYIFAQVFNQSYGGVPPSPVPYVLLLDGSWPTTLQLDTQQWLAPLWASGHASISSVRKTMDSLTGTINTIIRTHGDQSAPARGIVLGDQTCVGVEWAWFALPCGLLLLTSIFLTGTIIMSHQKVKQGAIEAGRRPWKSSTLPLLWCGLHDATKVRFGPLDDVDMMEECGERIEVALGREEGGRWKLG